MRIGAPKGAYKGEARVAITLDSADQLQKLGHNYFAESGAGAEQVAIDVDGMAAALNDADSVVIVPGYGMAADQAQQTDRKLVRELRARGKDVRFSIHLVAGHLPDHMNVLLAEGMKSTKLSLKPMPPSSWLERHRESRDTG